MLEVPYWTKCSVYLYPSTFEQKTKSLNFVWFKGCVVVIIVIVDTNAALSFMIIVILVVRNERCLI